jgi:DNA-directed RNA polymerase subunit RPC12/RpoP
MEKNKSIWICLRCGHEWINHHKADPRYCPLCGSCTIYVPKQIKITKPRFLKQSTIKKEIKAIAR